VGHAGTNHPGIISNIIIIIIIITIIIITILLLLLLLLIIIILIIITISPHHRPLPALPPAACRRGGAAHVACARGAGPVADRAAAAAERGRPARELLEGARHHRLRPGGEAWDRGRGVKGLMGHNGMMINIVMRMVVVVVVVL
jgi:hypothetical protein